MPGKDELTVRQLLVAEVATYLAHVAEADAGSGVNGAPHYHPYPRSEVVDLDASQDREVTRWTTPIDDGAWRRAWGLFDGDRLVGHLYLEGGMLPTELHRVNLGMGIIGSHHRRGGGSLLLRTAIDWTRRQPHIDWIDLGVFADNPGAQALYERHGFRAIGRTPDRFRVDGHSLDDISMTLDVARPPD